jgi:hypothetical protein
VNARATFTWPSSTLLTTTTAGGAALAGAKRRAPSGDADGDVDDEGDHVGPGDGSPARRLTS